MSSDRPEERTGHSTGDTEQATLTGESATELVNVKHHGRDGVRMIGRSTRFGNPFKMKKDGGEYTREGCVQAYREWFHEKVENDPEFRQAVKDLRGETLGCYCKPKACHGDVIVEYLRSLNSATEHSGGDEQ